MTVFFADDDILVLNKLRNLVDWEGLGYQLVGQATDGQRTVEQVLQLQPQLLVLDVEMPRKNGVEVTRELKEALPSLHILMLSNHDSFDYVRQSMRYGAKDYLLKHQLTKPLLLQKLKELEEQRRRETLSADSHDYFASVAKQQYLYSLVCGEPTDPAQHQLMVTQAEFGSRCSILAVMQILNFIPFTHFDGENGRRRLIESVINLAENIFSTVGNGLIVHIEYGRFALLFNFDGEVSHLRITDKVGTYLRLISVNIHKLLSVGTVCQASDVLGDITQLNRHYQTVCRQLDTRPLPGAAAPAPGATQQPPLTLLEEKALMDALLALDWQQTEQLVRSLYAQAQQRSSLEEERLISGLLQAGDRFAAVQQITLDAETRADIQHSFSELTHSQARLETVCRYFSLLVGQAVALSCGDYSPRIREAVQYIRMHYMQDLSLPVVAQQLGLSAAYLSRQFKRETGSSFVDYLTDYRIQVARRLLTQPGAELKDVSVRSGFRSYNYFLRVFKEKMGLTPTELQQQAAGR